MAGQKPQLFDIVLHCLFVMPDYLPVEKRFDVQVSCGKNENFVNNFVKSGFRVRLMVRKLVSRKNRESNIL